MTKQTKQVELAEELQKKLEIRLHNFIRQLLDKDLAYEEDDYDEYFDKDGRVSTSSPSGCTYHKDLKFFIKNDLSRIIAQAQQEAVESILGYITEYHSNMTEELEKDLSNDYVKGGVRVLTLVGRHLETLQQEQE